ncbi:MAG: PilZ domain-containing protein [Oscillospiraceae bacterium]|jgi:c-di-GMP-binding flagellar brake protein YcgR|nr:PilZ domain-containing protein [Oscillospiraceae bacterium]
MSIKLVPAIGDKIDIFRKNSPYYRTMVEYYADSTIYAQLPTYKGVPIILHTDEELTAVFYRETGRYSVRVRVVTLNLEGNLKNIEFKIISSPEKEQRRHAYRFPVRMDAAIYSLPEKDGEAFLVVDEERLIERVRTRDISETGVALLVGGNYAVGERYLLELDLKWPQPTSPPLLVVARVRRIHESPTGYKNTLVGLCFINGGARLAGLLGKYTLDMQRRQLQKRRI